MFLGTINSFLLGDFLDLLTANLYFTGDEMECIGEDLLNTQEQLVNPQRTQCFIEWQNRQKNHKTWQAEIAAQDKYILLYKPVVKSILYPTKQFQQKMYNTFNSRIKNTLNLLDYTE